MSPLAPSSACPTLTASSRFPSPPPTASGSYASVLSLTVLPPAAPTIATSLTALIGEGNPFTYAIPATGIVSAYAETGALPAGLMFNSATGVISGTATATGTFPLGITVSNDDGTATSTLTFNVQTATNYSGWTTTYNVTGGATGTPKNDDVPNLLKYFCDVNPTHAITATDRDALPVGGTTLIDGAEYITLTYRQNALASGLTPVIQSSTDLVTWTTAANANISQIGTDALTGDPIIQAAVPVTTTRQFIRLNVTAP